MNSEVNQVNAGGGASNFATVEQEGIGSGFGSGPGSFIDQVGEGGTVRLCGRQILPLLRHRNGSQKYGMRINRGTMIAV